MLKLENYCFDLMLLTLLEYIIRIDYYYEFYKLIS